MSSTSSVSSGPSHRPQRRAGTPQNSAAAQGVARLSLPIRLARQSDGQQAGNTRKLRVRDPRRRTINFRMQQDLAAQQDPGEGPSRRPNAPRGGALAGGTSARTPLQAETPTRNDNARRLHQRRTRRATGWPATVNLRNVQVTHTGAGRDSQITLRHNNRNETFRLVYSGTQTAGSRQQSSRIATAVYDEARTGRRDAPQRPTHYGGGWASTTAVADLPSTFSYATDLPDP